MDPQFILEVLQKDSACEVAEQVISGVFPTPDDLRRFCDVNNLLSEHTEEGTRFTLAPGYILGEVLAYMRSQISTENLAEQMEGVNIHEHHLKLRQLKTLRYRATTDMHVHSLCFLEGERQMRLHPALLPHLRARLESDGFLLEAVHE